MTYQAMTNETFNAIVSHARDNWTRAPYVLELKIDSSVDIGSPQLTPGFVTLHPIDYQGSDGLRERLHRLGRYDAAGHPESD